MNTNPHPSHNREIRHHFVVEDEEGTLARPHDTPIVLPQR